MRKSRYLIVLAAAGTLAAGCGTTVAGKQTPAAVLAAAVTKTGTQTAKIAVTIGIKSKGMSFSYAITGAFDFARSRGTITIPAPIGITELVIPPKAYIKYSANSIASSMKLPHGKTWVEMDTSGAAVNTGPLGATGNPKQLLSWLTAIAANEREVRTGTVRGVPATEYQFNIDPDKLAAKLPHSKPADVRKTFKELGKNGLLVYVWVDGQNLLRRFQLSLHLPAGSGGSSAGMLGMSGSPGLNVTMDFYDYGAPVNVSAPPASQVVKESAVMQGMASGSGASGSSGFSGSPVASLSASAAPPPVSPSP